jgi:hypothetical protein
VGDVCIEGTPIGSRLPSARFGRAADASDAVDLHLWFQETDPPARIVTNPRAFSGSLRRLLDEHPLSA